MSAEELVQVSRADFARSTRPLALALTPRPTPVHQPQALDLPSLKTHIWHVQPCSAKTGENIKVGFDWLISEVVNRLYFGVVPRPGPRADATEPNAAAI